MSPRWVRWSQGGYTVRCGTMRATWPWSCSLWQTLFSSWVSFLRLVWQHVFFMSLLVFIKSFSLKGSSPPKPWLCIGIVGFCNGGISFLTGVKFFYIKVLDVKLWSKCLRLNWNNFSTPMENRCWNRRYLIVWLILIPLQESYLTSSIASCTCLPTSLLFSFLWRWKLQTHGW